MRSIVFSLGLGILAVACAPSSEDADSTSDDLSGPVSIARACAVKKSYGSASLASLIPVAKSELPTAITVTNPVSLSYLDVPDVDRVYIVEETASTSFYDHRGLLLARATNTDPLVWSQPTGAALVCDGEAQPPPPPSSLALLKLADNDDKVLLGIAGDYAIYRTLPTDAGAPSKAYAVALTGGTPVFLFEIGVNETMQISNSVVAHWRGISAGVGVLDVWSQRSGLSAGIANASPVGSLKSDGKRMVFGQDATLSGAKPTSMAIAVRDIGATSNAIVMDGPYRANLATSNCTVQMSFAGGSLFGQYCSGVGVTETRARLVMLPAESTSLRRLDGATLDSANALVGNTKMSIDDKGEHVVAAMLTATGARGVVYNVGSSGNVQLPLGVGYTMLPNGKAVLVRTAENDLVASETDSGASSVLAKGVRGVHSMSPDGAYVLFNNNDKDPATGLVDVNVVRTEGGAPAKLLTSHGLPLGFSGDSKNVFYLTAAGTAATPSHPLLSTTLDGFASKQLMPEAAGGRVTKGQGFVAYSNYNAGSSTTPAVAEVSFIDANGNVSSLGAAVPVAAADTEVFVSEGHVTFTDLSVGNAGIFTVATP